MRRSEKFFAAVVLTIVIAFVVIIAHTGGDFGKVIREHDYNRRVERAASQ